MDVVPRDRGARYPDICMEIRLVETRGANSTATAINTNAGIGCR